MTMTELRITVRIPDDLLYRFSVDEWRTRLVREWDIDPDQINSFDDVAEVIFDLWYKGEEFQNEPIQFNLAPEA